MKKRHLTILGFALASVIAAPAVARTGYRIVLANGATIVSIRRARPPRHDSHVSPGIQRRPDRHSGRAGHLGRSGHGARAAAAASPGRRSRRPRRPRGPCPWARRNARDRRHRRRSPAAHRGAERRQRGQWRRRQQRRRPTAYGGGNPALYGGANVPVSGAANATMNGLGPNGLPDGAVLDRPVAGTRVDHRRQRLPGQSDFVSDDDRTERNAHALAGNARREHHDRSQWHARGDGYRTGSHRSERDAGRSPDGSDQPGFPQHRAERNADAGPAGSARKHGSANRPQRHADSCAAGRTGIRPAEYRAQRNPQHGGFEPSPLERKERLR